jgi:cytochrome c oxidase subunit II
MCGQGHWSMRGEIIVESQEEYDTWMATKKSRFYTTFPELDPSVKKAPADSTATKPVAMAQQPK